MPVGKSELMLFNKVDPQVVIERSNWVEYTPMTALNSDAPIEFKIISDQYIDLSESCLFVSFKFDEGVGYDSAPVNNILSSAFDDVEVSFGEKIVETTNYMYPYKSLLTMLLNYNADAKNNTLSTCGYYEDEAGKMDSKDNKGFVKRQKNKSQQYMGPLWLDTFNQSRFILPNVSISVKLKPSQNQFVLMYFEKTPSDKTSKQPKISIEDCRLYIRNVCVNQTVRLAHELGLKTENAVYPYQRSEMKNFVVSKGLANVSLDNIFNSRIPKMVIFGMVDNAAFNGSYSTNPFSFNHYNCNFVGLYKDGMSLPSKELTPDFANSNCVREYVSLMQNLEMFGKNNSNSISYEEFLKNGYSLFAFNLAPDLEYFKRQPLQVGNIRLDLRFSSPLPNAINIVMMGLFDSEFQITESRRVLI